MHQALRSSVHDRRVRSFVVLMFWSKTWHGAIEAAESVNVANRFSSLFAYSASHYVTANVSE